MPFSTAQPGTNMYFRPSTAPSSVQARTMQISSITNSAGIPTEQTFSMPPPIPPRTISMVMTTKIRPKMMASPELPTKVLNTTSPRDLLVSPAAAYTASAPKPAPNRSPTFRITYLMQ